MDLFCWVQSFLLFVITSGAKTPTPHILGAKRTCGGLNASKVVVLLLEGTKFHGAHTWRGKRVSFPTSIKKSIHPCTLKCTEKKYFNFCIYYSNSHTQKKGSSVIQRKEQWATMLERQFRTGCGKLNLIIHAILGILKVSQACKTYFCFSSAI